MNHRTQLFTSLSVAAVLGMTATATAETLTPDQALARIAGYEQAAMPKILHGATPGTMRLVHTVTGAADNLQAIYVFAPAARGNGYLLVSADDCAEPLLGYTDHGTFAPENMSPATQWWIAEYTRQIEYARNCPSLQAATRPERDAIAPMVTTQWNQDAPYNLLCPEYGGAHSMTGCVATAMAQVMKYHNWPTTGTGSHQYYYKGSWISMDFSSLTFDWDNMLDSYASDAGNERQRVAVASLMYACGVSTDMQYTTSQSGTADIFVASALVDYFGYDRNIRYAERDYFGMLDWEEFIYNQLRDYGPVQYSGSSADGGHSFVCDGYSSDGFFHINWGWGGISDGYFRLSALDPMTQGIGGSSSGFNFNQAVIANIRKARTTSRMYLNLMMDRGFSVTPVKTTADTRPGDQISIGNRVVNYSIGTASGSLGVKFTNEETGAERYSTSSTRFSLAALDQTPGYTAQIPSTLTAGSYIITPVMCGTDGVWKELPVKLSANQQVRMTIKNGVCSFADVNSGSCRAENLEVLTPIYLGNLFRMKAKVKNTGDTEFVGSLVPTLASGMTPIAKADQIPIDILPGESTDIEYTGIFNHFASASYPPAGTYTLYLVKESTNQIMSEGVEVELHAVPDNTALSLRSFGINGDANNVDRNSVEFTGEIACTDGYFGRNLTVVIFPYASGSVSSMGYINTGNLFIGAGESADFSAKGVLAAAEPGKKYFAVLYDGQTSVTPTGSEVLFTIADNSGLTTAGVWDDEIAVSRVYTTAGALVQETPGEADLSQLPCGIYIVETVTASGTRSASRQTVR